MSTPFCDCGPGRCDKKEGFAPPDGTACVAEAAEPQAEIPEDVFDPTAAEDAIRRENAGPQPDELIQAEDDFVEVGRIVIRHGVDRDGNEQIRFSWANTQTATVVGATIAVHEYAKGEMLRSLFSPGG